MAGSLSTDLVGTPQRERAGARVQERFDFQALWGMALLFRTHDSHVNYAVIFEFHDDIALLDDPVEPATVRFFQVKTKEKGIWAFTDLKRRKALQPKKAPGDLLSEIEASDDAPNNLDEQGSKQRGPSILGKMYHNVALFGDRVASATFVSNAHCDLHFEQAFDFRQCASATFSKLVEAVRLEYAAATDDEVALLGFERTDLSLQDSSTHMKGKLHDFVQKHVGAVEFPLEALFRVVAEECRKRSKFTGTAASFGDVIRLKGITRADVQNWLDTVKANVRVPSWEELNSLLTCPLDERMALRSAWSVYRAEALSQADEALRSIRRAIRDRIGRGFAASDGLMAVVDAAYADVESVGRRYLTPFQPPRLKVMIIYELYTKDAA